MEKLITSFDGTKIYYKINRFKTKTFLTFIHGLSGNHTAFNPIIELFNNKKMSTLTLDLRGHGKSHKRADISIENCAHDLDCILKKEKINKCILIAHCFGGPLALEFYKQVPEKVEKMVLMNTTYANPFTGRNVHDKFKNTMVTVLKKSLEYYKPVRKKFIHNNCELYKKRSLLYIFLKDLFANPTETYIKSLIAYFNNNQEHILSKIKIPVLIIGGEKDRYISHKASEFMNKKIKGSKMIILKKQIISLLSEIQS